jgi:hypothetical protein
VVETAAKNIPAGLSGGGGGPIGMKWKKPLKPKTTKTRPSRVRAMMVAIFMDKG